MKKTRGRPAATNEQPIERVLWAAADKLRGNLESGEYKHVVLGLVFLKYVSDAFEQRRRFLAEAVNDESSEYWAADPAVKAETIENRDEYPFHRCQECPRLSRRHRRASYRWTFVG